MCEWQPDVLRLHDLANIELKRARIAFLSACSTAEQTVDKLRDEGLHIVSEFQTAGFRHVIGCLWPTWDDISVRMAKSFYENLACSEGLSLGNRDVALALHKAVLEIRNGKGKNYKLPLEWVQYFHYGT